MIEKGKCPICGKDNGCAFNTGADPKSCWCMTTSVPKTLVKHVPDEFRNISCVCRNCIKNYEKKICVVGSLNIDYILNVKEFPLSGETIKATSLKTFFGGKGGNQATACSLLGLQTSMLGSIGKDVHGDDYLKSLKKKGINTKLIHRDSTTSGQAFILVDEQSENKIVTVGGANYALTQKWIDDHIEELLDHDVFLFSLDSSQDVLLYLMKLLDKHKKIMILDPAPFANFDHKMLDYVDYITPNETEYEHIKDSLNPSINVVLKRGSKGSSFIHNKMRINIPPYHVDAIDSVGAGDTFNAALCFGLMFNYTIEETLMIANIAGAMATKAEGAQNGMPKLETLLREKYT